MSASADLGLADVHPLPQVGADPARWEELRRRINRRVFLRSESTIVQVGTPQAVTGALRTQSEEVVARFNRFYRDVAAAYFTHPELRGEHLVNPLLDPLFELEANDPVTTPLSRFDAVLEPSGRVRVIELNSVGACLFHVRSMLYMIREMQRGGFAEDARALEALTADMVERGFKRYVDERLTTRAARPVVGGLTPSNWFRATHLVFREAFRRYGWDYTWGGPEHLEVTDGEIRLRGQRVDVLWADFFFYIAYQCLRYQETKFPSKMPDYGQTPAQAESLLADKRFLAHLRAGRVVNISPARAYLALPKSLLSWIHRSDRPIHDADRAFLADHVARTYSSIDRADGMISRDEVITNRGDYLIKPCQYGGSHGVEVGNMVAADAWRARIEAIWDEPGWAVQVFHQPIKTRDDSVLSLGLSNYDGLLGGIFLRTAPSLLVNARDAGFIPAVLG